MIDAGVITVDLLLAPESRPGDLRVRRASLLNERTLNLMDRLARSLGSCREVVPLVFSLCPCAHLVLRRTSAARSTAVSPSAR